MDVFRLNASHGTREEHQARIDAVRALARESGRFPPFCWICRGPKSASAISRRRLCSSKRAPIHHHRGAGPGNCERASTSYANFARDVKPGDRMLLADGAIELRVLATDGVSARMCVVSGGPISDHQGHQSSRRQPSASPRSPKRISPISISASPPASTWWRSPSSAPPSDVRLLRSERMGAGAFPSSPRSKSRQAWDNIESILDEADGVMVARGDLGVEIALEKVPRIQKSIIRRARRQGRFVITATQMLESMIENSTPTRAEVSDVANAIYDGTDAVMLSAETSMGKYPVEAVQFMARIAGETETAMRKQRLSGSARAAQCHQRRDPGRRRLPCRARRTGLRHRGLHLHRIERAPGFALPPAGEHLRHDAARKGGRQLSVNLRRDPVQAPDVASTDEMLAQMDRVLVEGGHLKAGDGGFHGRPTRGPPRHHQPDETPPHRRVRKNNVISNVKSQMSRLRRAQSALTPGL